MDRTIMLIFLISIGLILFLILIAFLIEKEKLAIKRMVQINSLYVCMLVFFILLNISLHFLFWPSFVLTVFLLFIYFIPFKFNSIQLKIDKNKIDERTTIFSRMFELKNESSHKTTFYKEYPELRLVDDELRSLPGILSPKASYFDAFHFEKAESYNQELAQLFPDITGNFNPIQSKESVSEIEKEICKIAAELGAVNVGFTQLHDHHFYSKMGRGDRYGKPIVSNHKFAVAITVEMDKMAVDKAPFAPVIAESCRQYLNSAKVAIGIAKLIRKKGYEATAHIDANYEVICPLVARDAGLGDIGRMGLLITPKLGPRVRIAVITTTLELKPSAKNYSNSVQYFCRICKKCAKACPSKAIQFENLVRDGKVRYKINHENCYGFWAKIGTDCARCMSVCPYSHPNNFLHKLVRIGINRNPFFAHLALYADHLFYGEIPKIQGR